MINYFKENLKIEDMFEESLLFATAMNDGKASITLGTDDDIIVNVLYTSNDKGIYHNNVVIIDNNEYPVNTSDEFISLVVNTLCDKNICDGKIELKLTIRTGYNLYDVDITLKDIYVIEKYRNIINSDQIPNTPFLSDMFLKILNVFNKFRISTHEMYNTMYIENVDKVYDDKLIHINVIGDGEYAFKTIGEAYDYINEYTYDKNTIIDEEGNRQPAKYNTVIEVLFQYKDFAWRSISRICYYVAMS